MAKMTKAQCSKAGKSLAKTGSSSAGKALAQCRWDKPKKKAAPKKPKAARPGARQSRRLAGKGPVRGPEPPKKPRKKPAKKKAPKRSAASKKIENILVPNFNPPKGDMKNFLAEQQRIWA
jgi:hypothetical protein